MPRDYQVEVLAYESIRAQEFAAFRAQIKDSKAMSGITDQLLLLIAEHYG